MAAPTESGSLTPTTASATISASCDTDSITTSCKQLLPLEPVFSSDEESAPLLVRRDEDTDNQGADHNYCGVNTMMKDPLAVNDPQDDPSVINSHSAEIIFGVPQSMATPSVTTETIDGQDAMDGVASNVVVHSTVTPEENFETGVPQSMATPSVTTETIDGQDAMDGVASNVVVHSPVTPEENLSFQQVGGRRRWDPQEACQLVKALTPYFLELQHSHLLPKVHEVTRILAKSGLMFIMEKNGKIRTMEKVRQEFKLFKK